MDSFLASLALFILLLGSLAGHLVVWQCVRQEAARMGKVHGALRDALAVANAAKEEQAGRIAWLSGRLDAEAKQPDWERFEGELRDRLMELTDHLTRLPTLEEVARIQGVAQLLAEQEEGSRNSSVGQILRRR